MSSTTDPTVPLPTATDIDDDDDDDDASSSQLQPPAATTPPQQPTVAPAPAPAPATETVGAGISSPASAPTTAPSNPSVAGSASASSTLLPPSATELADLLPSASPTALNPVNDSTGTGGGLGSGAAAGIGIGVALIVFLAVFGTWFFLRRRRARRTKTRTASGPSSDEEHAQKRLKPEIYAYRAGGAAEVSGDEKSRRRSELECPTYVAEVDGGQVFRAELPGSAVPAAPAGKKGDERLFGDVPIDEVDEPADAQKRVGDKDERLFSDPPIDQATETLEAESSSRPMEKKG
ncbi:uncharacterized protein M421DRAFT_90143 [Didymella exigua CBS 183.55]|uniref:Uncharacterized protein n=1 Tax=Didymella exigua CBS 183.55 TaxID=1150837 RepID=A0A6A5RY48_9PLEO|nr:uncharacterized protein M421DRAFT_90143 [Didymella exigua CBS 183.55]KAF1931948.1 hypothetical protein M421DRAFT_90143 [Didymella exigua CBS 183.55]